MNDQQSLFDLPEPVKPAEQPNPCVALYGPGPDGAKCRDCALLAGIRHDTTWYKCRLRKNTHGAATDHKVRWPACGRFERRTDDIPLYRGK